MKTEYRYLAQDLEGDIYLYPINAIKSQTLSKWFNYSGDRALFIMSGKHNDNWKETLIDLTKDDFKIEDGILTKTTNPHKEMMREWEESGRTKKVQFKVVDTDIWSDIRNDQLIWSRSCEYRFKPEVMYCRMYEVEDYKGVKYITSYSNNRPLSAMEIPGKFTRWIGDVQEVEVS